MLSPRPSVALPLTCCPEFIPSISGLLHCHAQATQYVDAGAVKDLVKLVQRGSESASAAGAAHALAVFTTGKNASTYRASVQTAGGIPALLTWVSAQQNDNLRILTCLSLDDLGLLVVG